MQATQYGGFMVKKISTLIATIIAASIMSVPAEAISWKATEVVMGDVNHDGVLNYEDISIIINSQIPNNISKTATKLTSSQKEIADINRNGIIDAKDVEILTSIYKDNLTPYEVKMIYDVETNFKTKTISMGDGFISPVAAGIDVSVWQGLIDWDTVAGTGINFAIIRAGYGTTEDDGGDIRFKENIEKAKEYGLDVGIYWYSYATTPEEAIKEADACYKMIKGEQLQYPVFFDIEEERQVELGQEVCSQMINAFCDRIASYGYYPGICTFASFLNECVDQETKDKYDIWFADYLLAETKSVNYYGDYQMWQYASIGYSEGIYGDLDLDYCYKRYPYIMEKYKLNDGIPNK